MGDKCKHTENGMYGKTGELHPTWKGGLKISPTGRVRVLVGDNKYRPRARLMMEEFLGRALLPDEHVHHINGDCSDDRIENLEIMSLSEHTRYHNTGENSHNYGRHLNDEVKKKMSDSAKRKFEDPEERRKLSEARKGKKFSEEHKKNLSIARRKRITTPETKAKMAESHRKRWAKIHQEAIDGKM